MGIFSHISEFSPSFEDNQLFSEKNVLTRSKRPGGGGQEEAVSIPRDGIGRQNIEGNCQAWLDQPHPHTRASYSSHSGGQGFAS